MTKIAKKLMAELVIRPAKTVTDVARELGMSRPALSNVLNGNAELSMELAIKLEVAYGMNAEKLLISQLRDRLAQVRAATNGGRDE